MPLKIKAQQDSKVLKEVGQAARFSILTPGSYYGDNFSI